LMSTLAEASLFWSKSRAQEAESLGAALVVTGSGIALPVPLTSRLPRLRMNSTIPPNTTRITTIEIIRVRFDIISLYGLIRDNLTRKTWVKQNLGRTPPNQHPQRIIDACHDRGQGGKNVLRCVRAYVAIWHARQCGRGRENIAQEQTGGKGA